MLTNKDTFISRLSIAISAVISCAWLGFYYGGIIGGKNLQIAIVVLGIVSAYALAFLCLAVAVAYLSTERLLWGTIWGIFCTGTIAISIFLINSLVRAIARYRSIDDRRH